MQYEREFLEGFRLVSFRRLTMMVSTPFLVLTTLALRAVLAIWGSIKLKIWKCYFLHCARLIQFISYQNSPVLAYINLKSCFLAVPSIKNHIMRRKHVH